MWKSPGLRLGGDKSLWGLHLEGYIWYNNLVKETFIIYDICQPEK